MIVKVQVSLMTTEKVQQVLIYDKKRSVFGIVPINKDLKKVMRGRPKAYFKAKMIKGIAHLGEEVEEQNW